jgi:hypothetical protein
VAIKAIDAAQNNTDSSKQDALDQAANEAEEKAAQARKTLERIQAAGMDASEE